MLNQNVPLPQVFHALGDPTRLVLVERLSRGPASVSELAEPLAMTLPAVIQHLRVLEASGLVRSEKVGRVRTCRVEPAALRQVEVWIEERRATWERSSGSVPVEPEPTLAPSTHSWERDTIRVPSRVCPSWSRTMKR